ncbi:MAG: glycosyltransferase family 4 protein [Thermoanaerobaculia bacterium]
MRIALVEFAAKGGLIHYAYQMGRAMHAEGADVTLITGVHYELAALPHPFRVEPLLRLWDPKPDADGASRLQKRARRGLRALQYYREWMRLMDSLHRLEPDVVQFGDIRFATDAIPLARASRGGWLMADVCHNVRPFAGGEGSSGTFTMSRLEQRAFARAYSQFDAIFVHYQRNVEIFAQTFPESREQVTPIVHGNEEIFRELASPDVSAASLRESLGLTADDRVALFFGTLSRYKGLDLLLDAFARVAARVPRAVLVVAGHEPPDFDRAQFLESARAQGIESRLRLVAGYVPSSSLAAWMGVGDVIVFPYRDVFQSGALQTAATFGAPIVATRVGAMPEVIRDGETGRLTSVDPDAIADAIVELLENRDRAAVLGAAAAQDAATRFSWRAVASAILARYDSLLGVRR